MTIPTPDELLSRRHSSLVERLSLDIGEWLIDRGGVRDFFDLTEFKRHNYFNSETKLYLEFIRSFCREHLEPKGWLCFLGYGFTGLFVYPKGSPRPDNAYGNDGLITNEL